ncbi:hypothetical protein N7475_010106 [Penicillium sp. IBT 31633x]|nr:hypothetical protein N7475_010106 [Penicillium sp. IBT 31633x]
MASDDTWINPLVRYRINQASDKQETQDCPDIALGHFDDVDVNFGAILKDTIVVLNNDDFHARITKKVTTLSEDCSTPRRPRLSKTSNILG